MKTKGWGPWRQDFYSICSQHTRSKDNCIRCQSGTWVNNWMHNIEGLVYKLNYKLWFWWVNRPNSKHRSELEKIFPNLKHEN